LTETPTSIPVSIMRFKAVIFDLDGTLIDSMQIWRKVDEEFLGMRGITVPTDLFEHLPQGNSFIQTAQYFKDRFGLKESVSGIMQEWTDMVTHHYKNDIPLKNGVLPLLVYLRENSIPIALGTSNSLFLAETVLVRNGIWKMFESVVTGDMDLMGKPFPDIYLRSSENLKIAPDLCVVIEDTLSGVRAGKAAGMTVYAIHDPDSFAEKDRIVAEADHYFFNYTELMQKLILS
jgi:HAD superfamily hydrolase (TIGR01509 family)